METRTDKTNAKTDSKPDPHIRDQANVKTSTIFLPKHETYNYVRNTRSTKNIFSQYENSAGVIVLVMWPGTTTDSLLRNANTEEKLNHEYKGVNQTFRFANF